MSSTRQFSRLSKMATVLVGMASIETLVCASAEAQSIAPPPIRRTIDERGVDLATGTFTVQTPSVSIGQEGFGALAFVRTWDSSVQAWRDNMTGTIDFVGSEYIVSLWGASERFTFNGSIFSPTEVSGSSLTFNSTTQTYSYTTANGAVAIFDKSKASTQPTQANEGRVISFTEPDGELTTFTYTVLTGSGFLAHRLQSVNNNLGYQLKFQYENDTPTTSGLNLVSVKGINNGVEYCAPAASTCTLTQSWPTLTFATVGSTLSVTDALSRTTQFIFTGANLTGIRRPTSPGANNWGINYIAGRVQAVGNSVGAWTYLYVDNANDRYTTVTDPNAQQRFIHTNLATGQVTYDQDAFGRSFTYEYNPTTKLLMKVTLSEGNSYELSYDGRGNLTQTRQKAKPGSGLADIVTSATFPTTCSNPKTCNLPTSATDARGFVTDYTWDSASGGLLTTTLPAPTTGGVRPQTRVTYSSLSAWFRQSSSGGVTQAATSVRRPTVVSACAITATCAGAATETRTILTYTAGNASTASNVLLSTSSTRSGNGTLTATTTITFDSVGNLLTVNGPLSGATDTTRYRYDAARQLIGEIGPDPDAAGSLKHRALRYTFNLDGQPTQLEQGTVNSQSDPDWANFATLQQQQMDYDQIGRMTNQRLMAGGTTFAVSQFSYDGENRLDCEAVRMNPSIFGALPASACTLGAQGPNGPDRIVKYLYNAADQVATTRLAFGTGKQQDIAATYTLNGPLATLTDAGGNKTTFEYDGFDRQTKVRFPSPTTPGSSSTTDYEEFTYDAGSNVTADRRRDGTSIGLGYDNLSRRTSMDLPGGTAGDVTYAYDNFGRMTSAAITGHTLSFGYDALNRVTSQTNPRGTLGYQYDLAGRRTRVTHPDAFFAVYDFNLANEVTAIRINGATTGVGVAARYTYDNLGRRTGVTRANGASVATSYGYDGASRLTSLEHTFPATSNNQSYGFTYNAAGEILTRTSSNAAYALPAPASGTVTYADNGLNQYTSVDAAAPTYDARGNITYDGTRSYTYDSLNRLATSGSGSIAWDPVNRMQSFTDASGTQTTLWDGDSLVIDYTTAGAVARRYVQGPSIDEPVVWYEGTGTTTPSYALTDQLGSVVAWANASGTPTQVNKFDEYGKPAAGNAGRFQFTGQTWLPSAIGNDLYYYKARIYSSTLGRFLQPDPILYGGDLNLYAYVANNPTNAIDPSGLCEASGYVNDDGEEGVSGTCPRRPIVVRSAGSAFSAHFQYLFDGPLMRQNELAPDERRARREGARCISPSDGPVYYRGGGLDLVLGLGLGFGVYNFNIPSTGASGVVVSGAGLGGLGGAAGGATGFVDRFENFLGPGGRFSAGLPRLYGVGVDVLFTAAGDDISGGGPSYGGGGGAYGGPTKTRLVSADRPECAR